MERGAVDIESLAGGLDLRHTLESGQSYLWNRLDGGMYDDVAVGQWYETVVEGTYLRVRQRNGTLEWRSTDDAVPILRRLLRLDDDLPSIYETLPEDPLIDQAFQRYSGMRLVQDPVFPCLISFICSAQMRVERIYRMQRRLAKAYGDAIELDGRTVHAFPRPSQLATATETDLRELGLGYRAPYVRDTARMVANGEDPATAAELPYAEARDYLTRFVGVGDKVADCVLLFSLGYLEAVPLDTWIRSAIEDAYPECDRGSYADTSAAIRRTFGGGYAGYAQTYVFHHLRTGT